MSNHILYLFTTVGVAKYFFLYSNFVLSSSRFFRSFPVSKGNEGIQVKEGVVDTLIENNEIYMQLDDDSGGKKRAKIDKNTNVTIGKKKWV